MYSYVRIEGMGSGETDGQVFISIRTFVSSPDEVESGQAATDAILEAGNAGQNLVI